MNVFQLFVYSCVTLSAPVSGELIQKTCNWKGDGALYATVEACLAKAPAIGSPVFSDVADGRKVEAAKCEPQAVRQ